MLNDRDIGAVLDEAVENWQPDGRRLLFIVPDHTRTCPLDRVFPLLYQRLERRARSLDFLVALGTHPPLSPEQIAQRVGLTAADLRARYGKARFFNHEWRNPAQLFEAGRLTQAETSAITQGRLALDVSVTCNRLVLDYDLVIIVGPVFPHEVVGFSGGNKYLFPGIAGPEIIDFFHWLGAVITNPVIIGNQWTPVRRVVDHAAALLPVERRALCMVVEHGGLAGLFAGTPEDAWSRAVELSRQLHVHYVERPFRTVLSCAPAMYDDLWTGGKCMYKVEPAVADGGTVIIYAPHITEISVTHGDILRRVGYHTRDFFVAQWDRYRRYPWGVLAHSTHVKGIGRYEHGVEQARVEVVLATGIPREQCEAVNLGYRDWRTIRHEEFEGREAEGVVCIPKAGETLYRWRHAPPELGGEAPA